MSLVFGVLLIVFSLLGLVTVHAMRGAGCRSCGRRICACLKRWEA